MSYDFFEPQYEPDATPATPPPHLDKAPDKTPRRYITPRSGLEATTGVGARVIRESLCLSADDLALWLGVSQRTVYYWESAPIAPVWVTTALVELGELTDEWVARINAEMMVCDVYRSGCREMGGGHVLPESWWRMVVGRAMTAAPGLAGQPMWADETGTDASIEELLDAPVDLYTATEETLRHLAGGELDESLHAPLAAVASPNPLAAVEVYIAALEVVHWCTADRPIKGEGADAGWAITMLLQAVLDRQSLRPALRHERGRHLIQAAGMRLAALDAHSDEAGVLHGLIDTITTTDDEGVRVGALRDLITDHVAPTRLGCDLAQLAVDLRDLRDPEKAPVLLHRWVELARTGQDDERG